MLFHITKPIYVWRGYRNPLADYSREETQLAADIKLHTTIVGDYFVNLSRICHFSELLSEESIIIHPSSFKKPKRGASFKQLKEIFKVPWLKEHYQILNRITKIHLLESFLSLLLQLLYHRSDRIFDPSIKDQVDILEKELRFLLTILGDISWMLLDNKAGFQNLSPQFEAVANQAGSFINYLYLSPQFEAVANQAGSFIHYLYFSADRAVEKKAERLAAVLNQINLLKASLESSTSSISAAYTTQGTSVVDSILILHSVVDGLEDLLNREDDPVPDIKDLVNLLHQELLLSHSSIKNMTTPQPSEIEELKEPLMRIGGIAHQAEFLSTSFLVKDAPLWYVINRLAHLNHMIEPIRTELQVITQKYQFGGLKVAELALHDKRTTEVNDMNVGFEDKTIEILYQLVGGGTQDLQIISILGMPGLGKTTLANKLYNHPSVRYKFDKLAWCVVSQTYKTTDTLADILIHIHSELGKEKILKMEEISLVLEVHKTLMGRRYLIVLDDIWESNVLDNLRRCFPNDGNGSRILLTSRNKDVAPPNSIIHELPFLSNDQCWELLEMKVFGSGNCPPQLQGIGKKIAARCCGLPLTVVVIGGVLSTVDKEESAWEEVGGSLGWYIDGEDNSVMQILELSYTHLPDRLKPCFLYFGEFEEDEAISVGKLKRLWISEGFIRREKDKSAEIIAGEYLMELIDKSLVMISKRRIDERGAKSCVIHDLLRDLCMKKSREENFLKYLNNYHNIYEKVHRVRALGQPTTLSYCQHVRSFVGDYSSKSFYVGDMRLLRVLHFQIIHCHAFGTEYLVNLKYLVIYYLPTWIDRLVNLEYLELQPEEVYLHPTIVNMKKLRYLRAESAEYHNDWNISNQTNNLEYLSGIRIRNHKDEDLLKCSPHLRKLKCKYDEEGVRKRVVYPRFDLRFLTQLDSLSLTGHLSKGNFGFPSNIRKLTLLRSGLPWEKMSIVGRLESLEVLILIDNAFVGERWDTRDGEFQKLRFLQLEWLRLSEWNVASCEHFPILQQLILINCFSLQEIPSEIGEITALELIEIEGGCPSSVLESAERIKEEQRDMGNEDLKVIIHKLL